MGVKEIQYNGDPHPTLSHQLVDYLVKRYGFRSPERCQRYFQTILGAVRVYDREVLEITSGPGWISLFAASQGAERVLTVAAGERDQLPVGGLAAEGEQLGLSNIEVSSRPFAGADLGTECFDLIVLRSSLTWIDPESCWTLDTDSSSRARYEEILRRLWNAARPGAQMVIMDVSRRNLWPSLGLRNPFSPETDWERHPPPSTWIEILKEVGFTDPKVEWLMPTPLAAVGRILPAGFASRAVGSRYRLVVTKPVTN